MLDDGKAQAGAAGGLAAAFIHTVEPLKHAGLAVLRASRTELSAEPYAADCMQGFYAALPFRLTGAQQRTISGAS